MKQICLKLHCSNIDDTIDEKESFIYYRWKFVYITLFQYMIILKIETLDTYETHLKQAVVGDSCSYYILNYLLFNA